MPEQKPFYITTAIHYVNDLPHIGHIYENVTADVIARYRRMLGQDVFFLTGTDEHGQKIERSAARQGITPIELADRVVAAHHQINAKLGISNDDFIRTTESRHRAGVEELIRRIREQSPEDIYAGEHSGWYCSSEETFVPESQVTGDRCESGHPVEKTTERNYFFRLSAYQQRLLDHYRSNPEFVQPSTRFNEVISFVENGLKDLSVSRTAIKWGLPWPDDSGHVVYVWMDALTNYISALGFGSEDDAQFRKYWPAHHLIGKDIARFHAVYWPAFLMAAGLPLPEKILCHGWWLRDNEKISKSTGNIVRPEPIIDQFGGDAFRYFLLREMVFGQDASYSDEAFLTRYNSELANDLGNTLSRTIKMCASYFEGRTPPVSCEDNDLRQAAAQFVPEYLRSMDSWAFQRGLDTVWKLLDAINSYIVAKEPWKKFKTEGASESLSRVLYNCLESFRIASVMLSPFMPEVTSDALSRIGVADVENHLTRASLEWGGLPVSASISAGEALFPRVDKSEFFGADTAPSKGQHMTDQTPSGTPATPPAETTEAIAPDANQISIDEFFKVDLRVAEVRDCVRVEKSKKLLQLSLHLGDHDRTVVAGIGTRYSPEDLIGRKVVIVANLKPARLMGIESQGMVLAAESEGTPAILQVDPATPPGTKVR